jgi:GT2 family glycosyltransferase
MNPVTVDATIVIPTYERAATLFETLQALTKVGNPRGRWEAIVVDDGSRPETLTAIDDWLKTAEVPVRLLRQVHQGPAAARNRGAREAKGAVLIFLDNDCVVTGDFIKYHVDVLSEHPGSWVIGRVVHPPEIRRTPFGRYRDDLLEAFHRSQKLSEISDTEGITAQNLAMWRSDFIRLGGFDEEFAAASSEDWELGRRARDLGIRILYDPRNIAVHNDWAVSLAQFCERQRLYSISDVLLWRKYGERTPRARLVRENGPIRWGSDPPRLVVKKAVKRLIATGAGRAVLRRACSIAERSLPDSRLSRRAYQLAVGVAIFQGVREGLGRYGEASAISEGGLVGDGDTTRAWGNRP